MAVGYIVRIIPRQQSQIVLSKITQQAPTTMEGVYIAQVIRRQKLPIVLYRITPATMVRVCTAQATHHR